ncbi:MAG: TetR/AcrR family transcriptional regulator [Spirochaetia bacterium]|nr:TetR/AcrR family transcriptional regulator [Spirochaetia bacterium]
MSTDFFMIVSMSFSHGQTPGLSTKELILKTALELFNRDGVLQTSTREIAEACGISQGNLTYHFARKNEIIISLFERLKESNDRIISEMAREDDFSPENFRTGIRKKFEAMHAYRFLFLDFLNILREIETLKTQYAKLDLQREKEFFQILEMLQRQNLLKKNLQVNAYTSLYRMFGIYFNFWLTDAELRLKHGADVIGEYEETAFQFLIPYLNKKGREMFLNRSC